jgi:hypothetical protein
MKIQYSVGDGFRGGKNLFNGSDNSGMSAREIRAKEVRGIYTISQMMRNPKISDDEIMQEIKYAAEQDPDIFSRNIRLPGDDTAQTLNLIAKQTGRNALNSRISEYEQFMVSEARENALDQLHSSDEH